jgi:hypothetical protein
LDHIFWGYSLKFSLEKIGLEKMVGTTNRSAPEVDIDIILMIPNILGSIISYIIINMGFEH